METIHFAEHVILPSFFITLRFGICQSQTF
jgi:hypothetical protein